MTSLRKFLRLASEDRWLLLRAVGLVGMTRLGLTLLPFRTLRRVLARLARPPADRSGSNLRPADRLIWAIKAASWRVPRASCLTQALAAQVLLARHGHEAHVRIGVARDEARRLQAHAWLEQDGRIVLGADEGRNYTLLQGLDWQTQPIASSGAARFEA